MVALKVRIEKLERQMRIVNKALEILPPLANPLEWTGLTERDVKVLEFLMEQEAKRTFTTTQIAKSIGEKEPSHLGRTNVYNSLRRLQKLARKKRQRILIYDRKFKNWRLNKEDFMFPTDLL